MIENYQFGSITINGKTYNHDVEIRLRGSVSGETPLEWEILPWQRKESHLIDEKDVIRAVEQKPEIIVIGTGEMGVAKITEGAQRLITQKEIKLIMDKTKEAARTLNVILENLKHDKETGIKAIGLLHLTC